MSITASARTTAIPPAAPAGETPAPQFPTKDSGLSTKDYLKSIQLPKDFSTPIEIPEESITALDSYEPTCDSLKLKKQLTTLHLQTASLNHASLALAKLVQLTDSKKPEVARRACMSLLKLAHLHTTQSLIPDMDNPFDDDEDDEETGSKGSRVKGSKAPKPAVRDGEAAPSELPATTSPLNISPPTLNSPLTIHYPPPPAVQRSSFSVQNFLHALTPLLLLLLLIQLLRITPPTPAQIPLYPSTFTLQPSSHSQFTTHHSEFPPSPDTIPLMTTQNAPTTSDHLAPLLSLIQKTWGYSTLRPLQQPAMQAMLDRRDSLVVLPTGGGKSLCYQAPALYLSQLGEGPTVVVSPLIALMKDQVDSLRSLGISAAQLDSSLSSDERRQVASDLRAGDLHLLYLSPERLVGGGEALHAMLRDAGVKTFAIDEAHCISAWGHDFRPEYRQLANLKQMFPDATVHAFTATATEPVRRDIAAQLALDNPELLVGNFDRPNLTYRILPRRELYAQIAEVLERHKDEAGIIYCLRRKDVDEITATLNATQSLGRKAIGYHAGMTPDQRRRAQEAFIEEEADLIVATIAFGMGIDRSNIRFVMHAGLPKSIEAYQQETGRAGRDGLEAECVLLYSGKDAMTWKSLIEKSAAEAQSAGTVLAPDYVTTALKHIDDMDRFARGATCRHKALVEHFGQKYVGPERVQGSKGTRVQGEQCDASPTLEPLNPVPLDPSSGCSACDHCLGDTTAVPDAQVIAQKILSAIARTDQRFGAGHILSILRGANTDRIRQFNHDKLPTYGLLREHPEAELRDYIYQLIGQGVLAQENLQLSTGHTAPILKLTKNSIAVLKGQHPVRLVQIVRKSATEARKTRGEAISWLGVDHELFDALRGFRKQIAGERNVPPYVIFSDATLRELARVRPTTMQNFRLVYGIGENKLNDLGPKFLPFITTHCAAKNLPMDIQSPPPPRGGSPVPPPAPTTPQKEQAFEMFRQGASIDDVSQQIARARSTTTEYLADFIASERPASIAPWIPDSTYKQVRDIQRQLATDRLKPIFLGLNEQVPYDQIRLVIAHLQTR